MAVQRIEVTAHTSAPPSAVYALLLDGASWPRWSPVETFELVQPGSDGGESVGAVRAFKTGRIRSVERIVGCQPDRGLSYELVEGLAVRAYRADVELTAGPSGTNIRWSSTFRAKVPGFGGLYRRTLTRFIQRCADGLAEHAATRQADA
ncbi:SRPBCC family protein [Phytoactinopolyspora limicola]|uniref:SRPBCC family protein n=1 Tax=Phytoactinopolyspora limicola TaxID=2715536 RepID=UPI00140882C4|nr:SRPBCC family protein [Phytoactinopolyspora limicola]